MNQQSAVDQPVTLNIESKVVGNALGHWRGPKCSNITRTEGPCTTSITFPGR